MNKKTNSPTTLQSPPPSGAPAHPGRSSERKLNGVATSEEALPDDAFEQPRDLNETQTKTKKRSRKGASKKSRKRKTAGQEREYFVQDGGVYVRVRDEETDGMVESKICGLLSVRASARNSCDNEWSRILEWTSPSGELHRWVMPLSQIALDERPIIARLLDGGLWIAAGRWYPHLVVNYIQTAPVEDQFECVSTTGWHRSSFVLPDVVIGPDADQVIFQSSEQPDLYRQCGSLDQWRDHVARYCVGNSRLVLAISCALAGPLMDLIELPSTGIHFAGLTSEGKTTTLYVGGSVLGGGGPLHFCQSWKSTINGLEMTAALHNGTALFLDELQSVDAHQAAECVYMLAAGIGKTRMSKTAQGLRPRLEWRLLFVSSGELSLADHVASVGKRLRGGAEVRLIYIPANAGKDLGLFENLHADESGCASGHEFAQLLAANTNRYYGTGLRAWLEVLTTDKDAFSRRARDIQQDFVRQYHPKDASGKPIPVTGEVLRVLAALGAIAAGGELATEEGVTGWPCGEAQRGAGVCFTAWWERRGTHGSSDLEAAIHQVRLLCEKYEVARFEPLDVTPEAKEYRVIQERFGYREVGSQSETIQFFVLPEAWRSELCKGYDAAAVAKELKKRGLLECDKTRLQFKKKIKGESVWTYALSGKILSGEE